MKALQFNDLSSARKLSDSPKNNAPAYDSDNSNGNFLSYKDLLREYRQQGNMQQQQQNKSLMNQQSSSAPQKSAVDMLNALSVSSGAMANKANAGMNQGTPFITTESSFMTQFRTSSGRANTLKGDVNGDNLVNSDDVDLMSKYYEKVRADKRSYGNSAQKFADENKMILQNADMDDDGNVDISDLAELRQISTSNRRANTLKGDVNGDGVIDKEDKNLMNKYVAGKLIGKELIKKEDMDFNAGDFDDNGDITVSDLADFDMALARANKPKPTGITQPIITETKSNSNVCLGNGVNGYNGYYIKGDVNGDGAVDICDSVALKQQITGLSKLSGAELTRADYNGDGQITVADLSLVVDTAIGLRQPEYLTLRINTDIVGLKESDPPGYLSNSGVYFRNGSNIYVKAENDHMMLVSDGQQEAWIGKNNENYNGVNVNVLAEHDNFYYATWITSYNNNGSVNFGYGWIQKIQKTDLVNNKKIAEIKNSIANLESTLADKLGDLVKNEIYKYHSNGINQLQGLVTGGYNLPHNDADTIKRTLAEKFAEHIYNQPGFTEDVVKNPSKFASFMKSISINDKFTVGRYTIDMSGYRFLGAGVCSANVSWNGRSDTIAFSSNLNQLREAMSKYMDIASEVTRDTVDDASKTVISKLTGLSKGVVSNAYDIGKGIVEKLATGRADYSKTSSALRNIGNDTLSIAIDKMIERAGNARGGWGKNNWIQTQKNNFHNIISQLSSTKRMLADTSSLSNESNLSNLENTVNSISSWISSLFE